MEQSDDVSTSNLFLHSLFENLELYFQGKLVSCKNYYSYCAYLQTHLSFSTDYKKDLLLSSLYVADTNAGIVGDTNTGYLARKGYIKKTAPVELIGPLFDDIIGGDRWILPNVDVRIRLKRSDPKFALLAPSDTVNLSINFEEAAFYVKRQMVSPKIADLHIKSLERGNALYPFTSNQVKTVSIPKESKNAVFENLFPSNKLPLLILIGFVKTDAVNGKLTKNPYCFDHFGLTNLNLSVDNLSMEYRNLNLTFNTQYLLAFQTLLNGLNLEQKSIGINRNSYIDGNVLFAFQLMGFEGDTSFMDRSGSIKLEVTFKEPLTEQVTGILLSQSQNLLTIDKYRNIEVENQGIF